MFSSALVKFSLKTLVFLFLACQAVLSRPDSIEVILSNPNVRVAHTAAQVLENRNFEQNEFGLNRYYADVSVPSVFLHTSVKTKQKSPAVLIFPGGGYNRIVIDKEGHDIARILTREGIASIVVKYATQPDGVKIRGSNPDIKMRQKILYGAAEALKTVLDSADAWNIDTSKIGIIGFSAGGHLSSLLLSNELNEEAFGGGRLKTIIKFAALIYPALEKIDLDNGNIELPNLFIAASSDDAVIQMENCFELFDKAKKEKTINELHIFSSGGHGFGKGKKGTGTELWPVLFIKWLRSIKIIL